MPVITLPTDGQVPYGTTLRTAINAINDQVDINTTDIAELGADWASYTPSLSGLTIGDGTLTGAFVRIGDTVLFRVSIVFGSTTAITGNVTVGLPTTAASAAFVSTGMLEDSGSARYVAFTFATTTGVEIYPLDTSGTYGRLNNVLSATVPFTWTTGDFIRLSGAYEAA